MPAVIGCLKDEGIIVALAKPQFEVGKGKVGKSGIVKDPGLHFEVLSRLGRHFKETGLSVVGMTWSPVLGAKGNIEYWLYLSKKPSVGYPIEGIESLVAKIVEDAHRELGRDV